VASSFQTPTLFLIASDLTKMQVDTNISESDIGGIKEGNKATFTVDAFPNRVFEGTVRQVRQSPQTVQNVVTFDAVISADNRDLALKPGMTASTRILVAERSGVVRVPSQALRYAPGLLEGAATSNALPEAPAGAPANPAGAGRVWVLRDGKAVPVAVKLGLDDGTFVEITAGDLSPGEQVITGDARGSNGPAAPSPQGP
jgi:HlyD family secretion protein